ncbi:MAG: cation-translocating P-type ATPase, partial [Planctomycetes bacterium]|nr:cation-translocating P-type ATPase [Planctomycetota bacterium]
MAHNILKDSIEAQTGRVSLKIVAILAGGVLVAASFLAKILLPESGVHSDVLAMAGAALLGIPVVVHALSHLFRGHMHMDELVAVAIVAAWATSDFQVAGAVAFFLLLANMVESRTALGARASIEGLIRLTPKKAHKIVEGVEHLVDPSTLSPDDVIRARPGDNIPADGLVLAGQTTVNQANITGESLPVDKAVGDEVFSGTSNLTGAIDVRVIRAGEDTTLGKVQKLILQAEKSKIPIMRLIDRYAGWYTPVVLMLAGIVLFFTKDIQRPITMLIVACPCALILAVPTAMVAALSCAARLGILVKNVQNLEIARTLTAVVFDKTGTLTTGELSLTRLKPLAGIDGADLLATAAAVEHYSKHPVAQAVVAKAKQARLPMGEVANFSEIPGKGVTAVMNGDVVRV